MNAADVLFLYQDLDAFTENDWRFWRKAAVAGGLALVSHKDGATVEPGADWTALRVGRQATLLQAPLLSCAEPEETTLPGPRWVMGDSASMAGAWASLLNDPGVHGIPSDSLASGVPFEPEECPDATDVQAIDFFCGEDPEDPTGERATLQFVALISVARSLQDRTCQLPMPCHRCDPNSGARHRRCTREPPLGGGTQHGDGGRRRGQARIPPGGLGR